MTAVPAAEVADPGARRRAIVGLVAALTVAAVVLAIVLAESGNPTAVDEAIHDFTRDWAERATWAVEIASAIGTATGGVGSTLFAAAAVIVLVVAKWRLPAMFLAASATVGVVVVEITKLSVGRNRPPGAETYVSDLEKSFPSGHSAAGIYIYLLLGLILWRLGSAGDHRWLRVAGAVLVAFGPLVGLSRIVLGVHWATDVLAGWAYGSSAALLVALVLWDRLAVVWPGRNGSPGG